MNARTSTLALLLVCVWLSPANAIVNESSPFEYNYLTAISASQSKHIAVNPNEAFVVSIILPKDCVVSYSGILEEEPQPKQGKDGGASGAGGGTERGFKDSKPLAKLQEIVEKAGAEICTEVKKTIQIVHEEQYGCYVISIKPPDGNDSLEYFSPTKADEIPDLTVNSLKEMSPQQAKQFLTDNHLGTFITVKPATLVFIIDPTDDLISFSSGVGASFLVSQKYAVRTTTVNGNRTSIIARDSPADDAYRPLVPAFVHLNMSKWWAVTMGVGANDGQFEYLLGASLRFKRICYLTAGAHFGQVEVLPLGVKMGDVVSDGTALSTMRHRQSAGFAIALSFTFMGKNQAAFSDLIPSPTKSTEK